MPFEKALIGILFCNPKFYPKMGWKVLNCSYQIKVQLFCFKTPFCDEMSSILNYNIIHDLFNINQIHWI